MSQTTPEDVLQALRGVQDPDLMKDIVTLGFVKRCEVEDGVARVTINLTTPACPVKDQMRTQAEELVRALPGIREVEVEMTAEVQGAPGPPRKIAPDIRHIVAVSSGKGGVGKSTVTVNLATALARTGAKVGILDCDVYGPDIPMMMGLTGQPEAVGQSLLPKERHGVATMSIGYLVPEDKPIIWRGPMIHKLLEQFLSDVQWGPLDYLLVYMPPGRGDAQLSLAQIVPLSGGLLVTTPQAVSAYDVSKAIAMFQQVNVPILGIVENMAGLVLSGRVLGAGPETAVELATEHGPERLSLDAEGRFEARLNLFGRGAADRLSERYGFPVLGRVPLDPAVRVGGDGGDPVTVAAPDSPIAREFAETAGRFAQRLAVLEHKSLPVFQ